MHLYRNILKQALNIAWHNKYLWFFGLFAALLGNGGIYDILIRGLSEDKSEKFFSGLQRISETGFFSFGTITNIFHLLKTDFFSIMVLFILGLIILASACFLIWLVIISQVGLVNNSANIILSKNKLGIRDGMASGSKHFWPVLWLNVIDKAILRIIFIFLSLLILNIIFKQGLLSIFILYIILFVIFIPLAIILSFIIKYAIAYIVIKGDGFLVSIKKGWRLFLVNWLVSIEMALILFFINFIFGLAIIFCILIIAVPFVFLAVLFYKLLSVVGFWLMTSLGLIILLFMVMAAGAFLSTFQTTSWTGLFIELIGRGGYSKILRIFKRE